jgi:hypothetical protein
LWSIDNRLGWRVVNDATGETVDGTEYQLTLADVAAVLDRVEAAYREGTGRLS